MAEREKVLTPRSLAAVLNPGVERNPQPRDALADPAGEPPGVLDAEERSVQDFVSAADTTELVLFRAGGECFAVPLDSVREVIDAAIFHRLPGMPAHVTAVISVAGRSLPIYDGARFLGVVPSGERPSVLVMKGTEEDAGLVVDALMATFPIEKSAIRKVPALEDGSGALAGVFFHGGELVALLDPSAFVRQRENPKPAAAAQKGRGDP